MEGSPYKHKRTAAQDILNKNLAQSIDLGLHRYSLGTDYSGPLTLRVTHIHSSSQDEQSSTHTSKPINSMKKSQIRQSKNIVSNLKMNLFNLQEKISQAHRQLQASPNKRSTIGARPGQFQKILELFVCSEVSEDESTINLESHKLLKMKSKGQFFAKKNTKYYINHLVKCLSLPSDPVITQIKEFIQSIKMSMLLKIPSQIDIQPHKITLSSPSLDKKKTILIQLSGVLINKRNVKLQEQDIQVGRGSSKFFVGLRTYLFSFLKKIRQSFEVVIFTIFEKKVAEEILEQIDPDRKLISDIITREKCLTLKDSFLCKDLRIINRNLKDICLVDCNSQSSILNTDNLIPILPFGSGQDRQLMQLQKFLLREVLPCKDVRQVLRDSFKLNRYWQYDRWQNLVREVYLD